MKKTIKRLAIHFIRLIFLSFLFDYCLQFRISDNRFQAEFKKLSHKPKIGRYTAKGRSIRYVEVGAEDKPMILFVHGSPGSSQDYLKYLKDTDLVAKARMIAVDRPGYGYSDFGKVMTSIEKQAACIAPILDLNKNSKPVLLVAHSYGGPVVARLAMDYPNKANGPMLMLAPGIDPDNERFFWFMKPLNWWGVRWLIPRSMRNSNFEKLSHPAELELMKTKWDALKNPTTFVHGYADWIVPIENSQFGVRMMANAPVDTIFDKDMNHQLIWNRYELVKAQLLKMLEE
jgi:pimeloyl-ACP methyl ester carboxylesterase